MAKVLKNLHVCGNILSSASYSFFALQCASCEATFGQWTSFLRHLEQTHGSFKAVSEDWKNDFVGVDEFKLEENIEFEGGGELGMRSMEDKHAVFLESKEDVEMNEGETDELMVEIMQIYGVKSESVDESNAGISQEQIDSSKESLAAEVQNVEKSPSSPADEGGEVDVSFKKFRFNLNDADYLAMSLSFLKVFQSQRLLWDPKHEYYRNARKRSLAQSKIRKFFKEKRIDLSDKVIQATISTVLRKYKLARQEQAEKGKVDAESRRLLRKCSFLAGTIKASESDATSSGDDEKSVTFETTILSNRNINHIPFSESEPLFLDFLELYKESPILWDTTLYNYNHKLDRKDVFEAWIDHFKSKYNLELTKADLSFSIVEFRRLYYKSIQRRESNLQLDDFAKFILENANFLPPKPTIKQVKCEHCNKVLHHEHTLKRHIYVDHGIGEKPFKCAFCEQSFEDHLVHRRHELRYHYKDYKYNCEYCQKAFFTRDELDRHLVKHTGELKFVCELCGRGFAKKTNLKLHNTRIHLRQRNFPCNMCPKAFYTKRLLQDHINAHLNIRDKICPTCGKGFTSHHSLIRHKQIHSEIKKYACKLCDARFHQFVGLNSHMKNTHKYVRGKNETASDDEDMPAEINT